MRIAVTSLLAVLVLAATASGQAPTRVSPVLLPTEAVSGTPWRAVVKLSRPARAARIEARGPSTLRAKLARIRDTARYAATLRFPTPGSWTITAVVASRRTRLGTVVVDVVRDPVLTDPFTLAVEPGGSLLVGQLRQGALARLDDGRATPIVENANVFHVYASARATYVAARDGAVYRLDGSSLTPVTPQMDASSVAVDAAGNLYVTQYVGYVKRIAPGGTVTTIAGDGTEGYAGDGSTGPSKLYHPHSVTLGADGALYIADTENRRVRRVDLTSGRISTFGGDVGLTVSLAAAPDGSIYSADVVRDGTGGGVVRISPDGTTRRVLSTATANGVAVAPDGTVYVNLWESKRIVRLNPTTGRTETVARG